MEKKETIQSAPEIKNVSGVFLKFQSLPGNGDKTMEDSYDEISYQLYLLGYKMSNN